MSRLIRTTFEPTERATASILIRDREVIEIAAYNRDTIAGMACFVAMPIAVIVLCLFNLS